MKKEILIFLPENYADWEGSYICSELNNPKTGYAVKTLSLSKNPVKSMGGFTVIPDYTINEIPENFHMLIMVGGTTWAKPQNEVVKSVVDMCVEKKIPVAAICDACTFLADKGYLDHIKHTGNSAAHLIKGAPGYKGKEHFIEKQAVSTKGFITANGTAAVEFAREILKYFEIMEQAELKEWYQMFKKGFYTS
ncbi:type 1 glutamine amidotransferase family protein [Oceanobacillus sp. FSL W8-0428]|uniref:type 1 glutamine amidotransferase family protein n=1 Tax=Oceanobacillus TaxID=182709 RepID=UPI0021A7EE52|nr:type 1 glutamine amidotransferase family protein [Oceanobacillus sojae]MCT1902968.1 glutamine amidotransferase [Oceanobacillus sojae]